MKFIEQFPSLRGEIIRIVHTLDDDKWLAIREQNRTPMLARTAHQNEFILPSAIHKHCLDKEKVKEVIDKELGIPHMQRARQLGKTWLVSFFVNKKKDIYKELGLK